MCSHLRTGSKPWKTSDMFLYTYGDMFPQTGELSEIKDISNYVEPVDFMVSKWYTYQSIFERKNLFVFLKN